MYYTSREVYEFISKQTGDPIIERKTCAISGQPFAIFQSDLDFYEKISPTFNGQKFQIPTPTLCPEERQRRRLSFRNERKLYRRQCDASKKSIISIYSPDKSYKVYDQKVRRSDSRDPMDYGMDFDFNKTFTENFSKLMIDIPHIASVAFDAENCQYTNQVMQCQNCYLIFSGIDSQNCLYGRNVRRSSNCIELNQVVGSQESSNIIIGLDCYNVQYGIHAMNCRDSLFLYYCEGCENCICCANLINKEYQIFNKQYTKEEYTLLKNQLLEMGLSTLGKQFLDFLQQQIKLGNNLFHNNGVCIGDQVRSSQRIHFGFTIADSDSCGYVRETEGSKQLRDVYISGYGSSFSYNSIAIGKNTYGNISTFNGTEMQFCLYCYNCFNSSNLFGCIGLRNKSYCIFNKQYTKEEYEIQIAKIIAHMQNTGEWGEFFHPSLSPFGYNETVAQEYYYTSSPSLLLSEKGDHKNESPSLSGEGFGVRFEDLKIFGYKRSTYNADPSLPAGVQTIEKKNYTEEQRNALLSQDNLETQVFLCSVSGRPYRLQKAEIEFYHKHHLPIPDKHPDIRHEERMKLRPGRTLFLRNCDCCGKEMLSVYAPKEVSLGDDENHEGKVYCEQCYQQEMYS